MSKYLKESYYSPKWVLPDHKSVQAVLQSEANSIQYSRQCKQRLQNKQSKSNCDNKKNNNTV
jgi:hypothetical protein